MQSEIRLQGAQSVNLPVQLQVGDVNTSVEVSSSALRRPSRCPAPARSASGVFSAQTGLPINMPPASTFTSPTFGRITSYDNRGPRTLQLSLKLQW